MNPNISIKLIITGGLILAFLACDRNDEKPRSKKNISSEDVGSSSLSSDSSEENKDDSKATETSKNYLSALNGKWNFDCSGDSTPPSLAGIPPYLEFLYLRFDQEKIYYKSMAVYEPGTCSSILDENEQFYQIESAVAYDGKNNTYRLELLEKGLVTKPRSVGFPTSLVVEINNDYIAVWEANQDPTRDEPRVFSKVE